VLENLCEERRVEALRRQVDAFRRGDHVGARSTGVDRLLPFDCDIVAVREELAVGAVARADVGHPGSGWKRLGRTADEL